MNGYELTVWALLVALGTQAFAAGLGIEGCLLRGQAPARRRLWLALAGGSLLLALHHGYTLELALRTGLHDLRQALLAVAAAICLALATAALRRQLA
ncbi:MAG TPA: hypothetical protein VF096_06295 [Azonexus sp.]